MPPREIKVFIASPGDLAVERRAFKDTLDDLNQGFGRGADVHFIPLGWEDALATTGRRAQSVINQDIDACDIFILTLHRRWGQEAPDAHPYTSYTEEEFYRALDRFEKTGTPEIFIFFKHIDQASMADAGPQLTKVLAFRKQLEQTRKVLYHGFPDEAAFKLEIDKHLVAYAQGKIPKLTDDNRIPILPDSALAEIKKAKAEAQAALKCAEAAERNAQDAESRAAAAEALADSKTTNAALMLAESAAKAALEGKIEQARQDFAKSLDGTTNLRVLYLAYEFFDRIGELGEAERLLRRWLAISGPDQLTASTAAAYGNLGLIYLTRGDLLRAEDMVRKSLAINETLGRLEGMASQYGNLGLIYKTRDDLGKAEEMHVTALAIEEKLGNLGGMASQYGNLGIIYFVRGELNKAEEMHVKALVIDEKLGNLGGMASQYGNLGTLYIIRDDLKKAEDMCSKSLAIEEKLGRLEGMANQYGNLGVINQTRGDLDKAEEMHRKSLAINEKLGSLEGVANQYGNLGINYESRGNLSQARILWTQARDTFAKIGMPHMVTKHQSWLDGLPPSPPSPPST